jgi:hypothetical protein
MRATRWLLPLLLPLSACPGSTTGVDPCAGVSCASGRTCVNGVCLAVDANLSFLDSRLDRPATDATRDRETTDARRDLAADGPSSDAAKLDAKKLDAKKLDAKKPDAKKPDAKKPDAKKPDAKKPDAKKPDLRPPDLRPPDTRPPDLLPPGKWYQANSQVCPTYCTGIGKANVASPEGARCISGEARPASGVAAGIVFSYGCWPSCTAMGGTIASVSVGIYCSRVRSRMATGATRPSAASAARYHPDTTSSRGPSIQRVC